MGKKVVGQCGACGGRVTMPDVWHGIYPPVPSCDSCGATAQQPQLPVIPMQPSPFRQLYATAHIVPGDGLSDPRLTGTATYRLGDF